MDNQSVSDYIINFESAAVDDPSVIRTQYRNAKTKIPINMYFHKTKQNQVLFHGAYMEIFIAQSSMEHRLVAIKGDKVILYGIFELRIWDTIPQDSETEVCTYKTRYIYPSTFTTIPNTITKKVMSLLGEEPNPYMILHYEKNDIFIESTIMARSSEISAKFVETLFKAFLPPILRYDELVTLLNENGIVNNIDFEINATTFEVMIAAQARYSKDLTIPYRMFLNKKDPDTPLTGAELTLVKATELPFILDTFSAFSFQDINYAVTMSANRHRTGKKSKTSSMEKLMHY
jgi:uncharacterized protein YhhL (DUF1145 family)